MLTDSLGNTLSLQDPGNVSAVNDFVEGFISCEARAVHVLRVADTDQAPSCRRIAQRSTCSPSRETGLSTLARSSTRHSRGLKAPSESHRVKADWSQPLRPG